MLTMLELDGKKVYPLGYYEGYSSEKMFTGSHDCVLEDTWNTFVVVYPVDIKTIDNGTITLAGFKGIPVEQIPQVSIGMKIGVRLVLFSLW